MISKIYFSVNNREKALQFEYPISRIFIFKDKYLVLLEVPITEHYPENVFCLTQTGDVLWQIEKKPMPHNNSSYYDIGYINNELKVYTHNTERIVDLNTGEILNSEWVK